MYRKFLSARSPLRLLEQGLHGGLGKKAFVRVLLCADDGAGLFDGDDIGDGPGDVKVDEPGAAPVGGFGSQDGRACHAGGAGDDHDAPRGSLVRVPSAGGEPGERLGASLRHAPDSSGSRENLKPARF